MQFEILEGTDTVRISLRPSEFYTACMMDYFHADDIVKLLQYMEEAREIEYFRTFIYPQNGKVTLYMDEEEYDIGWYLNDESCRTIVKNCLENARFFHNCTREEAFELLKNNGLVD